MHYVASVDVGVDNIYKLTQVLIDILTFLKIINWLKLIF